MLELNLNQIFQLTHINGRKEFHGEDRVTAQQGDTVAVAVRDRLVGQGLLGGPTGPRQAGWIQAAIVAGRPGIPPGAGPLDDRLRQDVTDGVRVIATDGESAVFVGDDASAALDRQLGEAAPGRFVGHDT